MFSWINKKMLVVYHSYLELPYLPASLAQLDAHPTEDREVVGSIPAGSATLFWKIDHEIFSTVILSLPLIQDGQLLVSRERMCTILVNPFKD